MFLLHSASGKGGGGIDGEWENRLYSRSSDCLNLPVTLRSSLHGGEKRAVL